MAKPIKFDESCDNEDLQSLFDSIAAGSEVPLQAVKEAPPAADASGDSDDLQALFDSVSAQVGESDAPVKEQARTPGEASESGSVFSSLGQMTRELHDTLRELGHDKILGDAARTIPDARQRLSYIIQMTEQAASRALNAIEIAKPIQEEIQTRSEALGVRWGKVFANQLSADEFKLLATDTHAFLNAMPKQAEATNAQLTEIMMAQDFQDLTGQVVKKVIELVENLETQLLRVLIEAKPPELHLEAPEGMLNGPVINADGRSDVVTSQSQVDDLLESLGF